MILDRVWYILYIVITTYTEVTCWMIKIQFFYILQYQCFTQIMNIYIHIGHSSIRFLQQMSKVKMSKKTGELLKCKEFEYSKEPNKKVWACSLECDNYNSYDKNRHTHFHPRHHVKQVVYGRLPVISIDIQKNFKE